MKWCSCGSTLSIWQITFVCPLPRARRAIVPKQGAMKGVQYFMSTKSGRSRRMRRPTRSQLKGLTVLTQRTICRSSGGGVVRVWLCPGKSSAGYCSVKVRMSTSAPRRWNVRAMISMIEASPPR